VSGPEFDLAGGLGNAASGAETPAGLYDRLFGQDAHRRTLAIIWATVDRDRLLAESGWTRTEYLPDDPFLGASVAVVRPATGEVLAVVEPVTEGRLAATLARHGEGPAGEYVEAPIPLDAIGRAATAAGLVVGRSATGPFGRSVIVVSGPVTGPHLILVERPPGTIGR
jgi:hypothetical protein